MMKGSALAGSPVREQVRSPDGIYHGCGGGQLLHLHVARTRERTCDGSPLAVGRTPDSGRLFLTAEPHTTKNLEPM